MIPWREMLRKAWHMLSLVYLAGYSLIGWPRVVPWLAAWTVFVAAVEFGRLYYKPLNDFLFSIFGPITRGFERDHVSGMIHSSLGVLVIVWAFGADARLVSAAIWCVAVGDAAAAVVGKWIGRIKLVGPKSLEGSLACLASCAAVCLWHGYGWGPALAAAGAATAVELAPTNRWFNDNLWIPVAAAVALRALG